MKQQLVVEVERRANREVVREVPVAGYDAANALSARLVREFGEGFSVLLTTKTGKLVTPECLHCGEAAPADKRWCAACEAAGPCAKCGDPRLPNLGCEPDAELCGACVYDAGPANGAALVREYERERALDASEARQ